MNPRNIKPIEFADILSFWFDEIDPKQQWQVSEEFDRLIANRFGAIHDSAVRGELYKWRTSASGRLAEIIVLDQFSRHIYRHQPDAFSSDASALVLAQWAVSLDCGREFDPVRSVFFYMPYMHSESSVIHELAVPLFSSVGMERSFDFELRHKKIIDTFGRFPHRNKILGRQSSSTEIEFLKTPGSSF